MNAQTAVDLAISEDEVKEYLHEVLRDLHKK
jgi:hypothetical protein